MPYFRCGGGGGVTPFAFLIVNYPSTASVSATNTNGGKDLATGKKLFFVTGAGDCSVTISQSGKTPKTTTVNFGAGEEGSSKTVTINFSLSLIENGAIVNDVLKEWLYYGQTGFSFIAWNDTYKTAKMMVILMLQTTTPRFTTMALRERGQSIITFLLILQN